jgi:hypothetical protein
MEETLPMSTPRAPRILCAPLVAAACLLAPAARAHGTIPTCVSLGERPSGAVFVGTNFGGLELGDGLTFTCELAVTGTQQALDIWLTLKTGAIAAVSTTSGFTRGVYLSDPAGCVFQAVPGTEELLVADLVLSPDGRGVIAIGSDATSRVVAVRDGVSETVHTHEGTPVGLRAAGDDVLAVFSDTDAIDVVHLRGAETNVSTHPLGPDKQLLPLGLSGASGARIAWLVERSPDGDTVISSPDFGRTLERRETFAGRLGGFASRGGEVFLQSPQLGVLRGGLATPFAPLAKSPHGSALAFDGTGRLLACGVPWQDGMAVGVSTDGLAFSPLLAFYDDLRRPVACPEAPEVTATCTTELDFIRDYYGFISDTPDDAEDPDNPEGPEPELAEAAPEVVEAAEPAPRRDEGCASAPFGLGTFIGLMGLRRRRASGHLSRSGART